MSPSRRQMMRQWRRSETGLNGVPVFEEHNHSKARPRPSLPTVQWLLRPDVPPERPRLTIADILAQALARDRERKEAPA